MKVLQLLKTSTGGVWALRHMRELVKLGVEVHAALPVDGPLVPAYHEAGIVVHPFQPHLPVGRPWRWPGLFRGFRELVERVQPDVLHSHFVGTTLTMRMALGRDHPVPRLFQVPGPLHLEHAPYRLGEIATAGPADYWVGSCRWTCDRYRASGVPDDHLFLSYYGLDLERFVRRPRGKLRRELGLSADTPVVGMVAYLYAPKRYLGQRRGLKGHEDLIDAMQICLRTRPELLCVMAGSAPAGAEAYERQVREYARERCGDRVVFLGFREDMPEIYPDFDVSVHPSHSENVGGVPESLLLEVPVVCTDVGGLPDAVIDGQTGWSVPPRDPPALAAAILEALADPAEARRRTLAGQALSRERFDTRRSAAQLAEIYAQVARHRREARS